MQQQCIDTWVHSMISSPRWFKRFFWCRSLKKSSLVIHFPAPQGRPEPLPFDNNSSEDELWTVTVYEIVDLGGWNNWVVSKNCTYVILYFTFSQNTKNVTFLSCCTRFLGHCVQPVEKNVVSSVTVELELAGDRNAWTPLLDARTGHPLVSEILHRV